MNHNASDNDHRRSADASVDDCYIDDYAFDISDYYRAVFSERKAAASVLGADHPLVQLMEDAVETCDETKLEVAQAAYDALPNHVLDHIRHPWMEHPPSAKARENLCKELAGKLLDTLKDKEPVDCYLRIHAWKAEEKDLFSEFDEDGHVVEPAMVYDLRDRKNLPLRVQIAEGSDKELVLELLKKISRKLERDWDKLTVRTSYFLTQDGSMHWANKCE